MLFNWVNEGNFNKNTTLYATLHVPRGYTRSPTKPWLAICDLHNNRLVDAIGQVPQLPLTTVYIMRTRPGCVFFSRRNGAIFEKHFFKKNFLLKDNKF